jgi:FkbM family methyltransferase
MPGSRRQEATTPRRSRDTPLSAIGPGGWSEAVLIKEGVAPETIIDVGAGAGTGPLLRAFPDAYHVLIEPQVELEPALRSHLEGRRGEVLITAVGDRDGEAVLHVDVNRPMVSSLIASPSRAGEARSVPLRTLDSLAAERRWRPPFGLKVDAEGADHLVIEGAAEVLRQCQFVIAEVFVTAPQADSGGLTFAQFVALMDARGFELRDILNAPRSRATGQLIYLDGYFMPSKSQSQ